MYDASRGSPSRPNDIVVSAIKFAKREDLPIAEIKRILAKRYPNNATSSKKFFSIIGQAQRRAIESLRSQFVRSTACNLFYFNVICLSLLI